MYPGLLQLSLTRESSHANACKEHRQEGLNIMWALTCFNYDFRLLVLGANCLKIDLTGMVSEISKNT